MRLLPRSRTGRVVAAAVAVAAAAAWWTTRDAGPAAPPPLPSQVSAEAWDRLLAGDAALTADTYRRLAGAHPGLNAAEATAVGRTAAAVARADLTAAGREQWPHYWPPAPTTTTPPPVRCAGLDVLGTSATTFEVPDQSPGTRWVKALVAYAGTCDGVDYTRAAPGVAYVYLTDADMAPAADAAAAPAGTEDAGGRWRPVREWAVPQAAGADADPGLPEWQLADLGPCGLVDQDRHRLRTLAAGAFDAMCRDAAAEDVVLVVSSAYRTRSEQAELFADAVEHYGSSEEARKWVAYADEATCESRHCAGTAVNVEPDAAALSWLHQVVGCVSDGQAGRTVAPGESCAAAEVPVRRLQRYGFVAPLPRIPGYLEFALPPGEQAEVAADCTPDAAGGVDAMVAAVFRCRLPRAGVPAAQVAQVTAEALVVSRCASGWNPAMRVLGGQYARQPNPADGRVYSEAGVFALRADLAEAGWLAGEATDPVVNIHAAASLWLATRGWEQFGCATGTDPGLPAGPVLPQYGGPLLPAWATQY